MSQSFVYDPQQQWQQDPQSATQQWQQPSQGQLTGQSQVPQGQLTGQSQVPQAQQQPSQPAGPTPLVGPPVLGKTPTAINQIFVTGGYKATHFRGGVVSGGFTPGETPGVDLASIALYVDYSMGNFTLPLQLPKDSILLWRVLMPYVAFAGGSGDTQVELGVAANGVGISPATNMGALNSITITPVVAPVPQANATNPFQIYITVTGNGNTSGSGLVVLVFARLAQIWN
jgi:hypothetical protein